jgi:PLAT/LH2 domain
MRTNNVAGAGTDADVEGQIVGSTGESTWIPLDNPGDDRERGDVDIYYLALNDIGDPIRVRLRAREESATPDGPTWNLDRVSVRKGEVPLAVKILLQAPVGNTQIKRKNFENAFRALPDTKVFEFDQEIVPGAFSRRGTATEWTYVERP